MIVSIFSKINNIEFKTKLSQWRVVKDDEFRKNYKCPLDKVITIDKIKRWSEIGWKRPNYKQVIKPPIQWFTNMTMDVEESKDEPYLKEGNNKIDYYSYKIRITKI